MEYILKVENLNYLNILKDINIELYNNSFNICIGNNCCGKTSLANCILNLNNYNGTVNLAVSNNEIGVVKENSELLYDTVMSNVLLPLLNLGYDEAKAKKIIYSFFKEFELENMLLKSIDSLTNSEKATLKILVSLIHSPKFILIDESLEYIDYTMKIKILNYLKKVSKSACVLIFTADSELLTYADNILIMDSGSILKNINYTDLENEEKLFNKLNLKLPFMIDISNKLKFYNVINKSYDKPEDLINSIW